MRGTLGRSWTAIAVGAVILVAAATSARAEREITLWSHWADHETKVAFVETAARKLEAKHSDVKVKITWYQKNPLYAALQSALRAGKGPDIFYLDPDRTEYIENGFLLALDDLINWDDVHAWARSAWQQDGKTWGFPLEASTVEWYYNKDLMKKLGVTLSEPDKQLSQAAFLDLVKKAKAAGITPIVQGVGDRPYPGAYVLHELLLKKLGKEAYGQLLNGKLSFKDSRVMDVFNYVGALVEAGAYPKSFSTLKLGESHYYFHTKPGGLIFPLGSWYTSRAFNPPDKGGQPVDFPLGLMNGPAMDGGACNACKTNNVAGSMVVNAATKHPDLAAELLNIMATPEMGNMWLSTVLVNTGIKSDASKISGKYKPYFEELAAVNVNADYFFGTPLQFFKGKCRQTFEQVMNAGFPAGLIDADKATDMMNKGCYKG
jgi:multiple sugar transport system substrate-binding protein